MKNLIVLTFILIGQTALAHKTDSIGIKVKNGKTYVIHKVEKGDGLYSLSKQYNISLKSIIEENPGSDKVIAIDQLIWIPTGKVAVMEEKVVKDYFSNAGNIKDNPRIQDNADETTEVSTFAKYHKVISGQTLYSISVLYNTSVEMIKTLNGLKNNELSEGQRLLVQDGKAVKTEVLKADDVVETDYENMKKEMDKNYEDVGFKSDVETKVKKEPDGYTIKIEKLVEYNIEKIEETGTCFIGADKIQSDKNLALHFNAPIGTVVMVTNPQTKSTVFIKVIGNFEKDEKSSQIIKLSSASAEQIGVKSKDPIMLSYAR